MQDYHLEKHQKHLAAGLCPDPLEKLKRCPRPHSHKKGKGGREGRKGAFWLSFSYAARHYWDVYEVVLVSSAEPVVSWSYVMDDRPKEEEFIFRTKTKHKDE